VAKKIAAIICGVSWPLWVILTFTPALWAVPPDPALIIIMVLLLSAIISTYILIVLAVRDYCRGHKGEC